MRASPSPLAWTRSLRFRLTLWYSGGLALALIAAALFVYLGARHVLGAETDMFLAANARRVLDAVRGQPGDAPDAADLAEAVGGGSAPTAPDRKASKRLLFDVTYLRVVAQASGRTLAASPSLAHQSALTASLDRLPGASKVDTRGFALAGPDEEHQMRVLTEPGQVGTVPVWVQVAVPWDHNADVLERLGRLLALGVPLLLAACAAGGWLLVGRTLQPIRRIVTEAERLDADALPRALLPEAVETDSEIGQLVTTLNRMTTRLHGAWQAQCRFADAQQRFAADASHELRTPLTILRGEIDLALARPRSLESYQATLGSAVEEIDRLSRIVEGLSFLAHRDAERMVPQTGEQVNLPDLCRRVVDNFRTQAHDKQIVLTLHLPKTDAPLVPKPDAPPAGGAASDAVWVPGSRDQLRRLLDNLVDNAFKYTPLCGTVAVSVQREPDPDGGAGLAVLRVADTGIGIAPGDLPHIFERFRRADQARTAEGSGLGLAICAQIAQAHGGTLTADSEPGRGSVFSVRLPALPFAPPPDGSGAQSAKS